MSLHVQRWGHGYAVFEGKARKTRAYSHREIALRQMDLMEEAARRAVQARERACLSCGGRFLSEHFGNRMCNRCRERKSGLGAGMPG